MTQDASTTIPIRGDEWLEPREGQYYRLDEAEQLEDIEQYRPGGFHPVLTEEFLGDNECVDGWTSLDK